MPIPAGALALTAGGAVVRAFAARGGLGVLRGLVTRFGVVQRDVGGWVIRNAQIPSLLRRIATLFGLTAAADWFIPGDIFPDLWQTAGALTGGGGGDDVWANSPYGAPTKTWQTVNNGVAIHFASFHTPNGTMNGVKKKDGSYRYWRPKKPIVLMPGGASDLRTLIRADKAVDRQLRSVKKIIDRRYPRRRSPAPRRPAGATTIIESGPGSVVT